MVKWTNVENLPSNEIDNDNDGYVECTIDGAGWDGVSITGGDDCDDSNVTFPVPQFRWWNSWQTDADDDGYAPDNDGTDCDDGDNTIYPSAPKLRWLINTCGGSLPVNEIDNDNDGYVECTLDSNGWDGSGNKSGDDCDDADDTIYRKNKVCGGLINTWVVLYPNESMMTVIICWVYFHNEGWDGDSGVTGDNDCDDTDTIYPTAPRFAMVWSIRVVVLCLPMRLMMIVMAM